MNLLIMTPIEMVSQIYGFQFPIWAKSLCSPLSIAGSYPDAPLSFDMQNYWKFGSTAISADCAAIECMRGVNKMRSVEYYRNYGRKLP